jgi:hypothetical protein
MWSAIQVKTDADRAIAATGLRLFRAQWQRVLSASLYFLEINHPTDTLYKIGVTHRPIDDRIVENLGHLMPHLGSAKIKVLRLFSHRGAVELYFKYRYHAYQHKLGSLTEYFELDNEQRRNVLSDLTRIGNKALNVIEQAILDGVKPIDPIIEQRLIEQRTREAERIARAERQAQWKQKQVEWRAARAAIERDSTSVHTARSIAHVYS